MAFADNNNDSHAAKIKSRADRPRDRQEIEESIHRDPGLDYIADISAEVRPATEEEGMHLATAELRAMRKERNSGGST